MFKRQFTVKKEQLRPVSNDLQLYDVIKNSYSNKKAKQLKGYNLDESLSNHNQQVYYNPENKKLLYSVTGTHNLSDIGTDFMLGIGKLKNTKRYKEADETLKEAKAKYGVDNATITSHSLGGVIGGYISKPNDTVYTLDKGATFKQRIRKNENAFRTSGDMVSILNKNDPSMKNLINPNPNTGSFLKDTLLAHNVDNIKGENIPIM